MIMIIVEYDLEINGIEAMWLELRCVNKKILLCNCYRPPNAPVAFWNNLSASIELAKEGNVNDIIITGDFNSDPHNNFRNYQKLTSLCSDFNLVNHISEPTRITPTSESCLDLFISNLNDKIKEVSVSHPLGNSDHCVIELKVNLNFSISKLMKD